jgi:hypothetical protein
MYIPGDPFEQRKRALISRLTAGRGRGSGFGGFRVERPAAFLSRGLGMGSGNPFVTRAAGLAQALSGYGGSTTQPAGPLPQNPEFPPLAPPSVPTPDAGVFTAALPMGRISLSPPSMANIFTTLQEQLSNYGLPGRFKVL